MLKLYEKYIDEEVFLSAVGFAVRLEDNVYPNYYGKASLVLTGDAVRNNKVTPKEVVEAKKYFINYFLDIYIGCNFGLALISNPELEKAFNDFNELVIKKGLRQYPGNRFDVVYSEYVVPYELKKHKLKARKKNKLFFLALFISQAKWILLNANIKNKSGNYISALIILIYFFDIIAANEIADTI